MTAGMVSVPAIVPLKAPGTSAGSRKWMIDSNTLIELHSSTKDCVLFYTLNGTKPDPFKKIGDKSTYHFIKAFSLQPGKRTVKAIAVLKDGSRESSVNTKVFQVDLAEEKSDDENVGKLDTTWKMQAEDNNINNEEKKLFKKVIRNSDENKTPKLQQNIVKKILTDSPVKNTARSFDLGSSDDDHSLRCFNCDALRPLDPYFRFCNQCGSNLPPAPGRLRTSQMSLNNDVYPCQNCGSIIPFGSSHCSVCDMRNSGNKRTKNTDRVNCYNCGTMNPRDASECLVCDENIKGSISNSKKEVAQKPSADFIVCTSCTRINSGDARYCDWCGTKPQLFSGTVSCQRCSASNELYAEYCCSCGKVLQTPIRKSFEETIDRGNVAVKDFQGNAMELLSTLIDDNSPSWKKIPTLPVAKRRNKNVSTQSGDGLLSKIEKLSIKGVLKDSPGQGYWRQQVDHVHHHLKIYTQNNIEFRESFSHLALSGLITATAEESINNAEMCLTVKFALKDDISKKPKKYGSKNIQSGQTLINAISSTKSSKLVRPSSGKSRPNSARSRPGSARKNKKISQKQLEKEKVDAKLSKLSEENLKLLNIVKSSKIIDFEKIQDLLDSDEIDVNTRDESNVPLLKLCVINKHFDLLPLLITAGADIDKSSGLKETTALHEAVSLGINGKNAIDILLDHGASVDVKDKKGNSPYDDAISSGIDFLIGRFTKQTSKDLLKDVIKI